MVLICACPYLSATPQGKGSHQAAVCWLFHGNLTPPRSLRAAPIACDGLITLELWLGGSIFNPVCCYGRAGSNPTVSPGFIARFGMKVVARRRYGLRFRAHTGTCLMNGYGVFKDRRENSTPSTGIYALGELRSLTPHCGLFQDLVRMIFLIFPKILIFQRWRADLLIPNFRAVSSSESCASP